MKAVNDFVDHLNSGHDLTSSQQRQLAMPYSSLYLTTNEKFMDWLRDMKALSFSDKQSLVRLESAIRSSTDRDEIANLYTQYVRLIQSLIRRATDRPGVVESFDVRGIKVQVLDRVSSEEIKRVVDALNYLHAMFKRHGLRPLFLDMLVKVEISQADRGAGFAGYYDRNTRTIRIPVGVHRPTGKILKNWYHELILHEIGHHVHYYIHPDAWADWNRVWNDDRVSDMVKEYGLPTDYAGTNPKEDFAETFVAFLTGQRLSPQARFRMQRALNLSGLLGKPVYRTAGVNFPANNVTP